MKKWNLKRKICFFLIVFCIFEYFGLAIITAITTKQINKFEYFVTHPLSIQYKLAYIGGVALFGGIITLLIIAHMLSLGKRRIGEEYGSAKVESADYLKHMKDNERNLLLTQNVHVSLNSYKTKQNNNVLVVGSSGAGKNKSFIEPNLLEANQNYLVIDPKGSSYELTKEYLEKEGYDVRCLNFVNPELSCGYNPLNYIQKETDIAFIAKRLAEIHEDKKNAQNPFWDNTSRLLIEAIITYVFYYDTKKNINRVFEMFNDYKVNRENSELMQVMDILKNSSEIRAKQMVNDFFGINKITEETLTTSLGDTSGRLQNFRYAEVQRILETDDLDFIALGTKPKQAIFIIISDSGDTTYNFLIEILYQQFFHIMYKEANKYQDKRLPYECAIIMDEFKNIKLPENFNSVLSTVRSRGIAIWIIIQGLSQLKELFKESWEQVMSNCSYFLYLGTTEQFSHEYISKSIGTETIVKHSYSGGDFLTRGRASVDVIGREIYKPNEVRELDNVYCFLFVNGKRPVYDKKITIFEGGKIVYDKFKIAKMLSNKNYDEEIKKILMRIEVDAKNYKKYITEYAYCFSSNEINMLKKFSVEDVVSFLQKKINLSCEPGKKSL